LRLVVTGQNVNWLEESLSCDILANMKRRIMLLIFLVCSIVQAFSFSVMQNVGNEQPFDSELELSKMDFSKPLAENQKEWIKACTISLVTIGPGDQLYAWFGHSALVVSQPNGQKVMYDYGLFDTSQKHFYLNFARGRMLYSVFASGANWRIEDALAEDRDFYWMDLNLTDEAKFTTVRFLQNNTKEENNTYLYHFYKDNCATRLRDIINAATGNQFRTWAESQSAGGTYRSFADRNISHDKVTAWFLDFLQGHSVDKNITRYDEMFLPASLYQAVKEFSYADGSPLCENVSVLNDTTGRNIRFVPYPKNTNNDLLYALAGLSLGLVSFLLLKTGKKRLWGLFNGTILFVLSLLGTLLLFMMTLSNMDMTWFNENILFINPLLWIACVKSFAVAVSTKHEARPILRTYRFFSILILLLVIAKGLFPTFLIQDNLNSILFLLPLYLVGFVRDGFSKPLPQ
jgi:hypothetical protein